MLSRVERAERLRAINEREKLIKSLTIRNNELHKHIDHLEKIIEGLVNENCSLLKKYKESEERLEHELKNNDVLVKYAHELFKRLCNMQKIRMVLPNVKEVHVPSKAFKPNPNDLETFFKESIAYGTKD